jgi:hypothetical protein
VDAYTARLQHPRNFGEHGSAVVHVLKYLATEHAIKSLRGKRQAIRILGGEAESL